jgi:hypothetical protein
MSAEAWPYQVMCSSGASSQVSEVIKGIAPEGWRSFFVSPKSISRNTSRKLVADRSGGGAVLWKVPSENWGDRRIRSARSPSGLPPKAA